MRDLPLVSGNSHSDLGQRVSQFFRRNALGKPYNLRHAWAIRSMLFGLPVELAAAQMGHGVREHCETYHQWISEQHHAQAMELLMTSPLRPTAP